jgi:hypothetical protein
MEVICGCMRGTTSRALRSAVTAPHLILDARYNWQHEDLGHLLPREHINRFG